MLDSANVDTSIQFTQIKSNNVIRRISFVKIYPFSLTFYTIVYYGVGYFNIRFESIIKNASSSTSHKKNYVLYCNVGLIVS